MTETPPPSDLPVAPTPGSKDADGSPYCERHGVWHVSGPEHSCEAWERAVQQRDQQGEINRLRATIARVKAANDDMRTWCSPYGFVVRCADHIDAALAQPDAQPTLDLADVREQIANALLAWHAKHAIICEHTQVIEYGGMADAVMTVLPKACIDPIECGHEAALGEAEATIASMRGLIESYPPGSVFVRSGAAALFLHHLDRPGDQGGAQPTEEK